MAHTTYTEDQANDICEHIATGRSLVSWCKANHVGYSTVMQWLNAHKDFADKYARARDHQAEYLAEEIQDIADEIGKDTQHQRLRVDTRKWIASKMKPKKYGDRTIHAGDEENPIVTKSDSAIESRLAQLLGKAGITDVAGGAGGPQEP